MDGIEIGRKIEEVIKVPGEGARNHHLRIRSLTRFLLHGSIGWMTTKHDQWQPGQVAITHGNEVINPDMFELTTNAHSRRRVLADGSIGSDENLRLVSTHAGQFLAGSVLGSLAASCVLVILHK
jgi:hypothetical protein